ncbi:MAG: phosphoadenylyl-sulfate reductase, partial [Bacteroidales bacterium]
EIITIDTGRLFPETYHIYNETVKKYKKEIKVYFPDYNYVEKMVSEKGPYSFYYSVENRLECCNIRKSMPLARALRGKKCWISGVRADQSENRSRMEKLEYDNKKGLFKYNPLFEWSYQDVVKYVKENNVPYNVLHDRGFLSIGCQPCTRAVESGEDFRAGRWWWEKGSQKECGIHLSQ